MNKSLPVVLVVGAAGDLGHRIVEALIVAKTASVRVGVRGGAFGKHKNFVGRWAAHGVEVVDTDLDKPDSLATACRGAQVVISAVQGGPETIVDGQTRLLEACLKSGVDRFVPSDFSEDLFSIPEGINPYLDCRRTFDSKVGPSGIGHTHFLNGGFMEAVFSSPGLIDSTAGTITYWGDDEVALDFTAMDDVASYLAAAVDDRSTLNSTVEVAGDRRTIAEITQDYREATGRSLHPVRRGSIDDGYAELARMKAQGAHPMAMLPLQYLLPMMSGEGRLRRVANNRYPAVRPTRLCDFMRVHYADPQS